MGQLVGVFLRKVLSYIPQFVGVLSIKNTPTRWQACKKYYHSSYFFLFLMMMMKAITATTTTTAATMIAGFMFISPFFAY